MTNEQSTHDYKKLLKDIAYNWFFTDPLLFMVYVRHSIKENVTMDIPFRSGNNKIEYNPLILLYLKKLDIVQKFKIEIIRIILLHPYQRQIENFIPHISILASNITITQKYLNELQLAARKNYEFYYQALIQITEKKTINEKDTKENQKNESKDGASDQHGTGFQNSELSFTQPSSFLQNLISKTSTQACDLWHEDPITQHEMCKIIHSSNQNNNWGSIPAHIVESYQTSLKSNFQTRLLSLFKTVNSDTFTYTRSKPNRRYGYIQMGTRKKFKPKVLIGIDTSQSITKASLEKFIASVKKIFLTKNLTIEILHFDSELKEKKALVFTKKNIYMPWNFKGRGGTNFQPLFDYYLASKKQSYTGLIIFTDGFASTPLLSKPIPKSNILWVLCNEFAAHHNASRLQHIGITTSL